MEDPVTKLIPAVAVPTAVAFFAAASIDTRAEAKKYKPPRVAKNVGKSVGGRAALNTGKTIGSAKRWGVNGMSTPVLTLDTPRSPTTAPLLQALQGDAQCEVAQQIQRVHTVKLDDEEDDAAKLVELNKRPRMRGVER